LGRFFWLSVSAVASSDALFIRSGTRGSRASTRTRSSTSLPREGRLQEGRLPPRLPLPLRLCRRASRCLRCPAALTCWAWLRLRLAATSAAKMTGAPSPLPLLRLRLLRSSLTLHPPLLRSRPRPPSPTTTSATSQRRRRLLRPRSTHSQPLATCSRSTAAAVHLRTAPSRWPRLPRQQR